MTVEDVVSPASREVADEAGADEVVALATMLARPPHIPAPRQDEDEDDFERMARPDGDELDVVALPRQRDEFTCGRCFLVTHLSRRVGDVCRDCS